MPEVGVTFFSRGRSQLIRFRLSVFNCNLCLYEVTITVNFSVRFVPGHPLKFKPNDKFVR